MQKKFDELNQLLKTFAAAKATHKAQIKAIQDDGNFTPQHKKQLQRPIDEQYIPLTDETLTKVEQLMQEISAGVDEKFNNSDFLTSTEFTNALKLIELSKGQLPIDVVDKINDTFKDNVNALMTLKSVYMAQKCYEGNIDLLMADRSQHANQITDAAYFTITQGEPLNKLVVPISQYAKSNGYFFDTDFLLADDM